jgi:glycosyltransferase involved in cell wall biosynthesis
MPLHLVALVESAQHVCCRYRLDAFRTLLETAGHTLQILELTGGLYSRITSITSTSLRSADAVIVQRKLLSIPEVLLLRRLARRLIFDFDDAIWLRDSYSNKGFISGKRQRRFRALVRTCDVVVAGNHLLAADTKAFARNIVVIPTCVEPKSYSIASETKNPGPATLVWVGTSSTLQGLEQNRDLLNAVGQAVPNIQLKIICDRFPTFTHLKVVPVAWDAETEAAEIATADIGIGFVPDDAWSRGKCGLKLLQYHAAGLAVIANPVGVQAEIVRHLETGMQATTVNEWVTAVQTLVNDPVLRQRLGRAGREQVERRYSVAEGGRLWLELLAQL